MNFWAKTDPKGAGARTIKQTTNKRNGHSPKQFRSSLGDIDLDRPRDREGTYEPEILERHKSNTSELEQKIISMYGKGMTVADINEHLADLYGVEITDPMISEMTNKILPEISAWQGRSLDNIYPIIFVDALFFKVREEHKIRKKAVYLVISIDLTGHKDILGIWPGEESESAKFWLSVMQDLQARGVQDVLIACSDNLIGISDSIKAIYPNTIIQKCIVHQIRNSLKYLASKNQKEFMADLKLVYKAKTKDEAERNLLALSEKWGKKYPIIINSWQRNWDELSAYFSFSTDIRRMIYTTNPIEGVNRRIRKVTKNRSLFPNESSLLKLVFLASKDIMKKWTMPVQTWAQIISQLKIHFDDRITLSI
jgi:transposase-like protein